METRNLEFSVTKEYQELLKEYPWMSFIPEEAKNSEGNIFQRKKGSSVIYLKIEDGYKCVTCGSEIITRGIAHPIWDGPFDLSGSGKCQYEQVPYCPKCEEKPNFSGSPITFKNN
jgi:ribosomal protein L37AE/L43A